VLYKGTRLAELGPWEDGDGVSREGRVWGGRWSWAKARAPSTKQQQ